jgi:hypothetical protein
MSEKGIFGGVFNNAEVLWFIILFLLLFWGHGNCDSKGID